MIQRMSWDTIAYPGRTSWFANPVPEVLRNGRRRNISICKPLILISDCLWRLGPLDAGIRVGGGGTYH